MDTLTIEKLPNQLFVVRYHGYCSPPVPAFCITRSFVRRVLDAARDSRGVGR